MFGHASSFDQDIGNWNVTGDAYGLHVPVSSSFDQDIGNWNTSQVTDMRSMFQSASSFDPDHCNWDTSSVTNTADIFGTPRLFRRNIPAQ